MPSADSANEPNQLDRLVSLMENYLAQQLQYSSEKAKLIGSACFANGFDTVDLVTEEFASANTYTNSVLISSEEIKSSFPSDSDQQQFFAHLQAALQHSLPLLALEPRPTAKVSSNSASESNTAAIAAYEDIVSLNVLDISDERIEEVRQLYQRQANYMVGDFNDKSLFQMLTVSRDRVRNLLQHLVDTRTRYKVKYMHDAKMANRFLENFQLLQHLKNEATRNAIQVSLGVYHVRVIPELPLKPQVKIDDDLEVFFQWGASAVRFINNLLTTGTNNALSLAPFQMDFWIIPKRRGLRADDDGAGDDNSGDENGDDDDEEEEDEDEDDDDHKSSDSKHDIDNIDIMNILRSEHLFHNEHDDKPLQIFAGPKAVAEDRYARVLGEEYQSFVVRLREQGKYHENAPQFHRFNMILDRRKLKDDKGQEKMTNDDTNQTESPSELYIYLPPESASRIDFRSEGGHVPEVFIANSKLTVLPKSGYSELDNDDEKQMHSFTAVADLNGRNFMLSFHVESKTCIRAYVFYDGGSMRFFPEDMVHVWPHWFVQSAKNGLFVQNQQMYLQRLQKITLRDDQFERFHQISTGKPDLHEPPLPPSK